MSKFSSVVFCSLFFVSTQSFADAKADYEGKCSACHGLGIAGAPKLNDPDNWKPRVDKGIETLYENAIKGFTGSAGVMPAKGGFMALSDEEVKAIVDYMVANSGL